MISQRDERFRLRMIYPRSLFDPPGADQFLEACKQAILELAVSIPARATTSR